MTAGLGPRTQAGRFVHLWGSVVTNLLYDNTQVKIWTIHRTDQPINTIFKHLHDENYVYMYAIPRTDFNYISVYVRLLYQR